MCLQMRVLDAECFNLWSNKFDINFCFFILFHTFHTSDPEVKNIVDKLANFVARNGPEFEKMTKQKQKDNPKFQFLFGGEHFQYYISKVKREQLSKYRIMLAMSRVILTFLLPYCRL